MLQQRSEMLHTVRQFFLEHGFLEVQTPLLADEVIPEEHIEPFTLGEQFLQASPELHMKLLLSADAEAIFQITRSFRKGEVGKHHRPEFTIVEWYRVGDDMRAGMRLLTDLVAKTLDTPAAVFTSYAKAFEQRVGVCPHTSDEDVLMAAGADWPSVPDQPEVLDRDNLLSFLFAKQVEPHLGRKAPEIIYHYPACQSALAKLTVDEQGLQIAERFELFFGGLELANGYHELTDAEELRSRLELVNESRTADGRPALPLPESLLAAMERGLLDCAGCALGFDRLLMLATGANDIGEVMTDVIES